MRASRRDLRSAALRGYRRGVEGMGGTMDMSDAIDAADAVADGLYDGRPLLYRIRFTNWLMAKPWPRKNGWRYRTIFRHCRYELPRNPGPVSEIGEVPLWARGRKRPLWRALWLTVTFPHVHHWSEDGDDLRPRGRWAPALDVFESLRRRGPV